MEGALAGLRVLDLSSVLAGPLTGTFLAECGAEVTKVEPPRGDVTQTWKSVGEPARSSSAYYEAANHGKTVVVKDLKSKAGRLWLEERLAQTDILLQNMKWNDLEPMGLEPDELSLRHPRLVHLRLVGSEFDKDRLAYDVVVQAETGFMDMNGHPDRPPAKMPVALMDVLASHQLRAGILAGLYQREKTGQGWYAEVSLFGSGLTALANQGTAWLMNGQRPQRQGSLHPNIAPYGDLIDCKDGAIVLAVGSDAQFTALCGVLGTDDLPQDDAFAVNAQRVVHRDALAQALNAAARSWPRQDLLVALRDAKVPAGAVYSVAEALSHPEFREAYVHGEPGKEKLRTSAVRVHRSPQQTTNDMLSGGDAQGV